MEDNEYESPMSMSEFTGCDRHGHQWRRIDATRLECAHCGEDRADVTASDASAGTARLPTVLTHKYTRAVEYAAALHGTDKRKGTDTTYLCHLLGVSALVLEAGGTEDEAIAGLLHDAVEDAGGLPRLADVRARFGDDVADIVEACSDSTDEDWKRNVDYWERKQKYLEHLENEADGRAVMVSLADKVHNIRALVTDLQRGLPKWKFNGTPAQVLLYYRELRRIGEARGVPDTLTIPLRLGIEAITPMLEQMEEQP